MHPWFDSVYTLFEQRLTTQSAHHAPLFIGPNGLGKTHLLASLAHRILCHNPQNGQPCGQCQSCQLIAGGTHPDKHSIVSENISIGVDAVREGIDKLLGSAQLSQNKVLLINDAHRMTTAAANALLKTLEEPTNNTYILLTANSKHGLLPTILSRCEQTVLTIPSATDVQQWLHDEHQVDLSLEDVTAYQNLPYLCLSSIAEDSLNFTAFKQSLSEIKQPGQALIQAQRWQNQAMDCISWTQQLCRMQSPNMSEQWRMIYDVTVQLMREVTHPGVNKSMLLNTLFNHLKEVVE